MSDTYVQLYVHVVFAVQSRAAMIGKSWKEELHQYITGIVQNNKHKMIQLNSMPDHVHMLVSMSPQQSLSAMMQLIKTQSSKWITQKQFCTIPFNWQEGFGAFTYSKSQVDYVTRYIQHQEAHHKKQTFLEEYRKFLDAFAVEWREQNIFKELI